jgi:SAM-dependent methyltransferase
MSHPEQLGYIRLMRKLVCPSAKKILEIGSYNVNEINGGIRAIFSDCDYTGVDLISGPGVDIVASGSEVDMPTDSFDVTLSSECFEHNPFWRETFANMYRMTSPGGVVIMTCATTGRVEHGTARSAQAELSPGTTSVGWNYYSNLTQSDFDAAFNINSMFSEYGFYTARTSHDLYFFGVKIGGEHPPLDFAAINRGIAELAALRPKGLKSLARNVARAPLGLLSSVFPEPIFQNLAVPYSKAVYRLGRLCGIDA